ncbi:hypothetical protein HBH98_182440 [Parastagonospora nodorum]|nr:hypothetical protein HBI06_244470 [Parastagonospora nodorum]KAH4224472.1 hypothetical protein HBI05_236730 [Parastagonospora nodorum]KAH4341253.1 hypothetical protein HBH98_182440 [Parastagonospora nodorum]KAH4894030.1 hypothetical protein HBI80_237890 [Parastagonospora nodorum]KAH4915758.1 hypothetical protein HBH73_238750 [Parastagonospora nodorum]
MGWGLLPRCHLRLSEGALSLVALFSTSGDITGPYFPPELVGLCNFEAFGEPRVAAATAYRQRERSGLGAERYQRPTHRAWLEE